jgi:hypothetical protein
MDPSNRDPLQSNSKVGDPTVSRFALPLKARFAKAFTDHRAHLIWHRWDVLIITFNRQNSSNIQSSIENIQNF